MRFLYIFLIILCLPIGFLTYGQDDCDEYKSFTDSTFEVGNKIIAPEIYFSLSGGGYVLPEHYDSVKVIADFLTRHPNIDIEIGYIQTLEVAKILTGNFQSIGLNRSKMNL